MSTATPRAPSSGTVRVPCQSLCSPREPDGARAEPEALSKRPCFTDRETGAARGGPGSGQDPMGEPGAGLGLEPGLEVPGGDLDLEAGGQRPPHCRAPREAKPRARSPLSAGRGAPFSPCSSAAHARPGTGEPLCHSRAPSEAAPPHRGHPGPAPGAHHRGPTHARLHGRVADCGTQLENCYSGAKRIKGTKYSGAGNEEDARAQAEQEVGPPKASWGHRQLGDERPELHCPLGLVGVQSIRLRPPEPSSLESAASPRRVGGLGLRWGGLRPPRPPPRAAPLPLLHRPQALEPFPRHR